ncbi:hypothetical protein [Aliamphritea ceti]|uniref:hypothetical protein n=1 Tax=Aliamphritea ceti TaxID=1524258 RepID=UPI0021C29C5D|nr:hypothetical protein [Aliamphritea ceti]
MIEILQRNDNSVDVEKLRGMFKESNAFTQEVKNNDSARNNGFASNKPYQEQNVKNDIARDIANYEITVNHANSSL